MERTRKSCSFSNPKLDQSLQKSSSNTNNNPELCSEFFNKQIKHNEFDEIKSTELRNSSLKNILGSSNKLQLVEENLDQCGELKAKDRDSSVIVDATETFFNRISSANSQLTANLKSGKQSLMNQYQKIADKKFKKDLLTQKRHQGGVQTKKNEFNNKENVFHFYSGTKSMPEKLKFSNSTNKEVSSVEKRLKLSTFSKTEFGSALKDSHGVSTHTGNSMDLPALYREWRMLTNTRNDNTVDQFMKSNKKPISYSLQRFSQEHSVVNDDLEESHLKMVNNPTQKKFQTNTSVLTNVLRENQGNVILESNDIPSTSQIEQSVIGTKQNIEDTDAPKMFKLNEETAIGYHLNNNLRMVSTSNICKLNDQFVSTQSTMDSINLNHICSESNDLIKKLIIASEEIPHKTLADEREQNTHKVSRSLDEFRDNSLNASKTLSTGSKQKFSPVKKRLRTALNEITLNKELYYKGAIVDYAPMQSVNCTFRNHVEGIFFDMLLRAVNDEPLVITVRNMTDWTNCVFEENIIIRRHLKIPIFILVDADPYGIEIMLTYKYGSLNMSHLSKDLAEPKIKWLGVLPSEIIPLAIEPLILTATDKNKIISILKRPYIQENDRIKEELNILLENNFKSEIEGVIKTDNYLTDFYLPNKLFNKAFF
ncbi:hypothetical protein FQA39_LY03936 [Lamprigera yunnana]|nr:hypothetical protein FQA39_LY03936 [Lamprigera yunnana]